MITTNGKTIATRRADAKGRFTFAQSKAGSGKHAPTVHGATAKRAGKLTVQNRKP